MAKRKTPPHDGPYNRICGGCSKRWQEGEGETIDIVRCPACAALGSKYIYGDESYRCYVRKKQRAFNKERTTQGSV